MIKGRGVPFALAVYFAAIGTLLTCAGVGIGQVVKASAGLSQQAGERDKTLVELRAESAREIRHALAKPLPRPEPLSPITARVAHVAGSVVVASRTDRQKLMDQARDAFAGVELSSSGVQSSAFAEPDRHAVH